MSLYLGKDNNNVSILHITKDSVPLNSLKTGKLPSTIFLNNLDFVTGVLYNLSDIRFISNGYYNVTTGRVPYSAISAISSRFTSNLIPIVFVIGDNKVLSSFENIYNADSYIWDYLDTGVLPNSGYTGHSSSIPSSIYKYKVVNGSYSSLSLLVTNLSFNVNTKTIVFTNNVFSYGGSISISKNDITINGTSLTTIPFMTHKPLTNVNGITGNAAGDKLYIPNVVNADGCSLYGNSSRVYIKNSSGNYLFDTDLGAVYTLEYNITPTYTVLKNTNMEKEVYINNISPVLGKGVFFIIHPHPFSPSNLSRQALWSILYIATTGETPITRVIASASNTTYEYLIKVSNITGVYRYHIIRRLVYLNNGDLGDPMDLFIDKVLRLN